MGDKSQAVPDSTIGCELRKSWNDIIFEPPWSSTAGLPKCLGHEKDAK